MNPTIQLAIAAIEGLLGAGATVTSGTAQGVIVFLERVIPEAVQAGMDLVQPIQNIIAALTGSGVVTPEQVAQLQAQSDALDAALDSAAQADGLSGV